MKLSIERDRKRLASVLVLLIFRSVNDPNQTLKPKRTTRGNDDKSDDPAFPIGSSHTVGTTYTRQDARSLILTTGGTIASRTDAPMIAGPALVQAVPQLTDYANISVERIYDWVVQNYAEALVKNLLKESTRNFLIMTTLPVSSIYSRNRHAGGDCLFSKLGGEIR